MTLIATYITRFGIVQASDSMLVSSSGASEEGEKVFMVGFLQAALSFSGSYSINGMPINEWMPQFIKGTEKDRVQSLEEFSERLRSTMEGQARDYEIEKGFLVHICGYGLPSDGKAIPEFWFVRNIPGMDDFSGEYSKPVTSFFISEDFLKRDYQGQLKESFFNPDDYAARFYVNGTAPGRLGFLNASRALQQYFEHMWAQATNEFHEPRSLDDTAQVVCVYFDVVNALYTISGYQPKPIGGPTQVVTIPKPHSSAPSPL